MDAALQRLVGQVQAARAARTPLDIRGGSTKAFYGGEPVGDALDVTPLAGITSYEPSELVVTVRCGTLLAELEAVLTEKGQCLPFEPPRFDAVGRPGGTAGGTVGGMVAAGLSGPARAAVGSVRDYVLGAALLNGRAELLNFGGTVMKNVAGYDVSRALAGSMGCLGVICQVSLKVLPVAQGTLSLRLEMGESQAIQRMNEWGGQPLPLNATAWWEGTLVLRLAGAMAAVRTARATLGGEVVQASMASAFWAGVRDHSDEFFAAAALAVQGGAALWRVSVPATTPPLNLSGEQLVEWGGGQRWLCTSAPAATVRDAAIAAGGHATLFRAFDKRAGVFTPLKPAQERIQRALKASFDPDGVFNPGRLYAGL